MTKKLQSYWIAVVSSLILPTMLLLGYNLYIDPFQIFHKDFNKPLTLINKAQVESYQHAGIINNYPIKSIVLGNSHSSNYLPSMLRRTLNARQPFNFSMNGAPISEQSLVGRYAFKKHSIEYVLWGISSNHLMQSANKKHSKRKFPIYLYDDNRLNDVRFFKTFDLQAYYDQKQILKREICESYNSTKKNRRMFDRQSSWYWQNLESFDRPVFVANVIIGKRKIDYSKLKIHLHPVSFSIKDNKEVGLKRFIKNCNENIDKNILPLVEGNPATKFNFVFTAYPTLVEQLSKVYSKRRYIAKLLVMKNFVHRFNKYGNVKIFAFGLEKFPDNLRLYKDGDHYHIAVNDFILQCIANRKNILTKDLIDNYLFDFDKNVNDYRLFAEWLPNGDNITHRGKRLSIKKAKKLIIQSDRSNKVASYIKKSPF